MLCDWVLIAGCDSRITAEDMANLNCTIRIGKDGLAFKDAPDNYAQAIVDAIGDDLPYFYTSQDYYITVKMEESGGLVVEKTKAPKH